MRLIPGYVKNYIKFLDKRVFSIVFLLLAIMVFVNYSYGIEHNIFSLENRLLRFFGFFFLFTFTFCSVYLITFLIKKESPPFKTFFYLLLLICPALFAAKMTINAVPNFLSDVLSYPVFQYWRLVLHWPIKAVLMLLAIIALWKWGKYDEPVSGMSVKTGNQLSYFLLLACMLPLLALTVMDAGFHEMYPRVKNISFIDIVVTNPWGYRLLYELAYGSDFFTIELFFRGFLVLAFTRYAGKDAILPMAAFYCTIHFGKPLPECITSFFGGLILGAIVYNTRSIWGGLIVHLGIAWAMELLFILNFKF